MKKIIPLFLLVFLIISSFNVYATATYTGVSADISTTVRILRGMTWNGTAINVLDHNGDKNVTSWNTGLDFVGLLFNLSTTQSVSSLAYNGSGTYYYGYDGGINQQAVIETYTNGTNKRTFFTLPNNNVAAGLAWNGTHWGVLLSVTAGKLVIYDSDGSRVFNGTLIGTNLGGLTWNSENSTWFGVDIGNDMGFEIDLDGNLTNYNFSLNAQNNPNGIVYFNRRFYVGDDQAFTIKEYFENDEPQNPVFISPSSGQIVALTQGTLTVSVSSADLDNDTLTYDYYVDDVPEFLGVGSSVSLTLFKGDHTIKVSAYDGSAYSGNSTISYTVVGYAETYSSGDIPVIAIDLVGSIWVVWVLFGGIIAIVGIYLFFRPKIKNGVF